MRSGLFNRGQELAWIPLEYEKKAEKKFKKILGSLGEFIQNRDLAHEQRTLLSYLELYVREAQADLQVKHGEATRWRINYDLHCLGSGGIPPSDPCGYAVEDRCESIIDEDNKPFKQCKTKEDVENVYKALWDKQEEKNRKRGGSFKSFHGITNMKVTKISKGYEES